MSVSSAYSEIAQGAELMAAAISEGGKLIYAAAGSSGLMALADASELTGTFGIPPEKIEIHMAGGVPADGRMPGHTEDQVSHVDFAKEDIAIILSASGSTPYSLSIAEQAKKAGAKIIALANNGGTPLLEKANVAIHLPTQPEVVAGSTRLGAGTAQKVALNMLSTMMGVKLGHVFKGMMVNVIADNEKLRQRAQNIVCNIADVSNDTAQSALAQTNGDVKTAIIVASGRSVETAIKLLKHNKGHLDPCLKPN